MDSFYSLKVKDNQGKTVDLGQYRGKVLLIANTASKCGYTPQYEQLQALYEKFKDKGLVVLGFPSNDFGQQEPGSNDEVAKFCKLNFGVTFPLFDKQPVSGQQKQVMFTYLTEHAPKSDQGEVKWNFEKFLVDKNGKVVGRFRSGVKPDDTKIVKMVEAQLAQ